MPFVKIDGVGNPNTAITYRQAVEWLYSVSYSMKFSAKKGMNRDYVVPPLEALWWSDDPGTFSRREKESWKWTVMIMVPEFMTDTMFEDAIAKTLFKRDDRPSSLRMEPFSEGR